jgi:Na+-driven multidrug efflux pump
VATILSLSRQRFFFVPTIFLLSNQFGMQGLFMAQPVADGLTSIFTALLFIYVYREIKELEAESAGGIKGKNNLKYKQESA